MKRIDFYSGLLVLADTHMDPAFAGAEAAIWQTLVDLGAAGVVSGFTVAETAPPSIGVDITGGVGIDKLGRRVVFDPDPTPRRLSCLFDVDGVSTAVVTNGNKRYLGIFAQFGRSGSDPVPGGGFLTLEDGCTLVVRQGVEGLSPSQVAVHAEDLLVADVLLSRDGFGVTTLTLDQTRKELWVPFAKRDEATFGPLALNESLDGVTSTKMLGAFHLDVSEFYPGATFTLEAVGFGTVGMGWVLQLWNDTDAEYLAEYLLFDNTTPTVKTVVLPLVGDKVYRLRMLVDDVLPGPPAASDFAFLGSARILVS